jgi:hypothetical protein
MKIQILHDIKDCIDGYNPVLINNEDINLECPLNSISSILVLQTIELVSYKNIDKFLAKLVSLLRIGGNIVISGVDLYCFNRDLINQTIDAKTYNDVIFARNGIYTAQDMMNKLISLNLTIDKNVLRGSIYELHASRSK